MAPAARAAGSSARLRARELHVDDDGDAAAISTDGLCDRLFAFSHVFFEISSCSFQLPLCNFFFKLNLASQV
jgi:hypothetical protein